MSYRTATKETNPRMMTQTDLDRLYAIAFGDGYAEGRGDEKNKDIL